MERTRKVNGRTDGRTDRQRARHNTSSTGVLKLSNIENFKFLARFANSAFYKIHISGAANRHAPVYLFSFF